MSEEKSQNNKSNVKPIGRGAVLLDWFFNSTEGSLKTIESAFEELTKIDSSKDAASSFLIAFTNIVGILLEGGVKLTSASVKYGIEFVNGREIILDDEPITEEKVDRTKREVKEFQDKANSPEHKNLPESTDQEKDEAMRKHPKVAEALEREDEGYEADDEDDLGSEVGDDEYDLEEDEGVVAEPDHHHHKKHRHTVSSPPTDITEARAEQPHNSSDLHI